MARHNHSQGSKRSTHSSLTQDTDNTESLLAKFSQAEKLEAQLAAIDEDKKAKKKLPPGTDPKAQGLRAKLCQVLIEAIVADPVMSHSKDASRRLWHSCFYSRVSELRMELSKEKSRAKRKRQGSGGDVAGSEKIVGMVQEQLKASIDEALNLYDWLIDKMLKLLQPMSQSQSTNVSESSENDDYEHAVVAILYWSHLYMGDLLRYKESFKQAEETYLKCAKLYPGNGNPFNQLAVVAQSQDSLFAVALYYYARSMMATQAPSAMSDSNLKRLFTSNAKWLDEHAREDDSFSRQCVEVNESEGNKADKKALKQWQQRQKTALNRMALAKFVHLQWSFVKGVSSDGTVFQDVIQDMDSMLDIFTTLINKASFSETLCCKIVAILSFATLGAGNDGKLCNASTFAKKRRKDPTWKEDDIIASNAIVFSFVLRFCTVLMNDIENILVNNKGGKIGPLRAAPAMLLGISFVNAMYKGSEWFHGLPHFPGKGSSSAKSPGNTCDIIRDLCKQSHDDFWRSVARLANQLDSFTKPSSEDEDTPDLIDVKDFAEFCGYVPFDSFLKRVENHTSGKSKYASTEEVISVLSEKKTTTTKKMESETQTIIKLFLSFADENTALSTVYGYDQSEFFLARNPETNERELYQTNDSVSDQDDDAIDAAGTNFSPDPSQPGDDMETQRQEEHAVMNEAVPLKMTYSDTGVALLTPAALLDSNKSVDQEKENDHAAAALNPAPTEPEVSQSVLPPVGDTIFNLPAQIQPAPSQPTKETLPPPPGLMPPPGFSQQSQMTNANLMSNNDFVQNHVNNLGFITQTIPVETLNPFAQVAPMVIEEFGASLNQPSHLNNNRSLENKLYHQTLGMGPSMNSLFNSNQSLDQLMTSDAFGPVPQQAEPDDQSNSIMKFLFEGNDPSSENVNPPSNKDPSFHTMNPFAK